MSYARGGMSDGRSVRGDFPWVEMSVYQPELQYINSQYIVASKCSI